MFPKSTASCTILKGSGPILYMLATTLTQNFHRISLAVMSCGYLWLWTFNRDPHVLLKFLTMQAYFLTWMYFALLCCRKEQILGYSTGRLFQLCFVLQLFVTPSYWALIHFPMVQSGKFPHYEVLWNAYIHAAPILLLVLELGVCRRQIHGCWRDSVVFGYAVAVPLNLLYSHLQKPVYKFMKYKTTGDYLMVMLLGVTLGGMHWLCYCCLGRGGRREVVDSMVLHRRKK